MRTVSGNVSQDPGYQQTGEDDRKDKRHCIPQSLKASTLKEYFPLQFKINSMLYCYCHAFLKISNTDVLKKNNATVHSDHLIFINVHVPSFQT